MGKWSNLKEGLVKFVQPESWQTKIDKVKRDEYAKLSRLELCKEYLKVSLEKDTLKDKLGDLNTREEAIEQLLVDFLETEGDSQIKNDAGTFFIKDDPYCSVVDRKVFNSWIRENGLEDLLSVNYQTTSGLVKTHLEEGKPIPPGISVFMKTSIGHRKSKS